MQHLIDPRTGMPAKTDLAEVSVVTDGALRGEVYAKSAILLGAAMCIAFLETRGMPYAVVPAEGAVSSAGPRGIAPLAAGFITWRCSSCAPRRQAPFSLF